MLFSNLTFNGSYISSHAITILYENALDVNDISESNVFRGKSLVGRVLFGEMSQTEYYHVS